MCMFVIVYTRNLKNEALTTAKCFIHSGVSIAAKRKKYQTACYYSKTIVLGKKSILPSLKGTNMTSAS